MGSSEGSCQQPRETAANKAKACSQISADTDDGDADGNDDAYKNYAGRGRCTAEQSARDVVGIGVPTFVLPPKSPTRSFLIRNLGTVDRSQTVATAVRASGYYGISPSTTRINSDFQPRGEEGRDLLRGYKDDLKAPEHTLNSPKVALRQSSLSCLLYTSPSPRDRQKSRMPSSA